VADLIELEEHPLAHDLQRTHLLGVLFLREVHLSVPALSDLGQDLKVTVTKPSSTLSEVGSFATEVLVQSCSVDLGRCVGGRRVLFMKLMESVLTCVDVAQKIEIMIQEV
jgi:hypothetical protein